MFCFVSSIVLSGCIISSSAFGGVTMRSQRFSANSLDAAYGRNIGKGIDSISNKVSEQERLLADYKQKVEEQKKAKIIALERAKSMDNQHQKHVPHTSRSPISAFTVTPSSSSVPVTSAARNKNEDSLLDEYRKKVAAQQAAKMAAARGLSASAVTAATPSIPSVAVVSEVSSVISSNKEDSLLAEYRKKVAAQKAAKMAAARGLSVNAFTAAAPSIPSVAVVSEVSSVISTNKEDSLLAEYRKKMAAQKAAKIAAARGLSVNAFTTATPSIPSVAVVSEVSSVISTNKEDSLLAEYRKKVAAQKAAKMAAARGLSSPVSSVVSALSPSKPKSVGTAIPVVTKSFTPVSTVKTVISNEATALDEYRLKAAAQLAAKKAAAKGSFVSRR